MSGLTNIFQLGSTASQRQDEFQALLTSTMALKDLGGPPCLVAHGSCTAAKLDGPAALHRGIVTDQKTGSWLMAAGTVVAMEGNNDPHGSLVDLLSAYLETGPRALDRYDGHFAIAIYNAREDSLSIISDPFGLFSIYYARRGQQLLVSTSALALTRQLSAKASSLMFHTYLWSGRTLAEQTFWPEVKRLGPGRVLKIQSDSLSEHEYWHPTFEKDIARLNMREALEVADERISRVVQRSLAREGKVWADLTGGFDTRIVTMFLAKNNIPFTAYCVGPSGHPDVEIARQIGRELGWEYRHMALPEDWARQQDQWFETALTKGDGMLSAFQLASVLKIGQERALTSPVTLTGSGGDEFRYLCNKMDAIIPALLPPIDVCAIVSQYYLEPTPSHILREDHKTEVHDIIAAQMGRLMDGYPADIPNVFLYDITFSRYRHPTHSGAYLSAQAGNNRPLSPLVFKEVENLGLSINPQWRIRYDFRFARNLIGKVNPRLAAIRTLNGEPALPIRLDTLNKFGPLYKYLINLFAGRFSQQVFKKQIVPFPSHEQYESYPLSASKIAWLRYAMERDLLTPSKMVSGVLYKEEELNRWLSESLQGQHRFHEFLDRVITMEMVLRVTGTGLD